MRLFIKETDLRYEVSKAPEPKVDRETGAQRHDRESSLPLWLVQLGVKGPHGLEVINVTVAAASSPKVSVDDRVAVTGLEAIPWATREGSVRIAWRAESITPLTASKAA